MRYDLVFYWTGGTQSGYWNAARPMNGETLDDLADRIRAMGYVTRFGSSAIGSPDRGPSGQEIGLVLGANLPAGLRD